MSIEYMTVIYRCADDAAAKALWAQIRPLFMAEEGPIKITGVANDDHMTRLDTVRDLTMLPKGGHTDGFFLDMIEDCLNASDIESWRTEHADILGETQP